MQEEGTLINSENVKTLIILPNDIVTSLGSYFGCRLLRVTIINRYGRNKMKFLKYFMLELYR